MTFKGPFQCKLLYDSMIFSPLRVAFLSELPVPTLLFFLLYFTFNMVLLSHTGFQAPRTLPSLSPFCPVPAVQSRCWGVPRCLFGVLLPPEEAPVPGPVSSRDLHTVQRT